MGFANRNDKLQQHKGAEVTYPGLASRDGSGHGQRANNFSLKRSTV